jgi:CHAD domain-containing protein
VGSYISANGVKANHEITHCGDILQQGLREFLTIAEKNAGLYLEHRKPEALHQYRVALRQARVLVKANKNGVLSAESARTLNASFKALVEPTGDLRDTEVFIDQLQDYNYVLSGLLDEGQQRVMDDLLWQAYKGRNQVMSWFAGSEFRCRFSFLYELLGRLEFERQDDGMQCVHDFVTRQNSWIESRIHRLQELPVDELHELRIRVKNLRYTSNFYKQAKASREIKKNKKLQDYLGLLHDYAVQRELMLSYIGQKQADDRYLKPVALFVGYFLRHISQLELQEIEQIRRYIV